MHVEFVIGSLPQLVSMFISLKYSNWVFTTLHDDMEKELLKQTSFDGIDEEEICDALDVAVFRGMFELAKHLISFISHESLCHLAIFFMEEGENIEWWLEHGISSDIWVRLLRLSVNYREKYMFDLLQKHPVELSDTEWEEVNDLFFTVEERRNYWKKRFI